MPYAQLAIYPPASEGTPEGTPEEMVPWTAADLKRAMGGRYAHRRPAAISLAGTLAVELELVQTHQHEAELLDHAHEASLHHLVAASDKRRLKRRSALLPALPKAMHLVPGAEGHPLLESDPLPSDAFVAAEESSSSSRSSRGEGGGRESGQARSVDPGMVALKFVCRMRGGKRLLHRRHGLDATEIRDGAREATRRWFRGMCERTLDERGADAAEREWLMSTFVARRGSIEMGEAFSFLASLDDDGHAEWTQLVSMGALSPWDAVARQQRYVLKAKQAAEANLHEQHARGHEQHFAELAHTKEAPPAQRTRRALAPDAAVAAAIPHKPGTSRSHAARPSHASSKRAKAAAAAA